MLVTLVVYACVASFVAWAVFRSDGWEGQRAVWQRRRAAVVLGVLWGPMFVAFWVCAIHDWAVNRQRWW